LSSAKTVIEVDGSIHDNDEVKQNDEIRLKAEEVIPQIETHLKEKIDISKDSST
jgi:very-short-patch-repair endonuclease